MNLYQRVLGTPFVYNRVRPLVVGDIDMSPFYDRLQASSEDVILDVGCGTGNALVHLNGFSRYEGIDTDEVAIEFARTTYANRIGVSFKCKLCTTDDVAELQPSLVALFGLLHHISDEQILALFSTLKASAKLRRIVTVDIVYLPHSPVSNLLARLDRGKFCRRRPDYESLVVQSGLRLTQSEIMRSHPTRGLAKYLVMTIEP
jgi:SAM-dependent methyltransferase